MICVATCLLLYNPSAYQIPLFRHMCGLGRVKLTGYLLGQWANAPCVHPYILLSTAMRERNKNKRTGGQTLEMMKWWMKNNVKNRRKRCVCDKCSNTAGKQWCLTGNLHKTKEAFARWTGRVFRRVWGSTKSSKHSSWEKPQEFHVGFTTKSITGFGKRSTIAVFRQLG